MSNPIWYLLSTARGNVRILLALVGFSLLFASLPAQKKDKQIRNSLKLAKEFVEFEEYGNAIPHIEQLLKHDSINARYNYWMGVCLFKVYKKNQALKFLEITARQNPDIDPEFHRYYAYVLHYNLLYDKAIEEYRQEMERFEPASKDYEMLNNRISQCLYAQKADAVPANENMTIANMGSAINTEYAEHSPVISADNKTLIFTARRPECLGADPEAGFYDEDIYVSKSVDGRWTKAENIGLPVNSKGHDATISLTADGETLYLYRHKKDGGLYRTDFDPETKKWREPTSIQRPLNSKYYEASICQSADSSLLFFTSNRFGGMGGLDIYMCRRTGPNSWTEPQNLGQRINSRFNEDAPYFHPDGKTLYFSSDGPKGYGGYDIFVTQFDPSSQTFSDPINLGRPINSPDDEIYFVLSGDGMHGYYTSGMEGGLGEKDIYEVSFPKPNHKSYKIEVVGVVQDANTMDTLSGLLRLVDHESGKALDSLQYNAATGQYRFALEPQRAYSIEVRADNYLPGVAFLEPSIATSEDLKIIKNLFLSRPAITNIEEPKPQAISLEHLYFDFDKDDLRDASKQELDMVLDQLKDNPDFRVEIEGHTDWYNTYDYNVDLSMRRTQSATAYLRENGIEPRRIIERWMSESKPIDSNENDRGRQFNRHCEIRLVNGKGLVVLASVPLREGSNGPWIDHTTPQGEPGFDYPSTGEKPNQEASVPVLLASSDYSAGLEITKVVTPVFHNLYFDFDRSDLRDQDLAELGAVATWLQAHPGQSLLLKGHTDATGDEAYNNLLAQRRCKSAIDYLMEKGITQDRIHFESFSETKPQASNGDAQGRQANRRVEFEIIEGQGVIAQSAP